MGGWWLQGWSDVALSGPAGRRGWRSYVGSSSPLTEHRNNEIHRLCGLVRPLPPDVRAAVLERECHQDTSLQKEVIAVIESEQDAANLPPLTVDRRRVDDGAATTQAMPARAGMPMHAARPSAGSQLQPGQMLGDRFRIIRLLGTGGMGEVYQADDLKLGQLVALKLLVSPTGTNGSRMDRFRNEVRTARQVTHRNVCRVHDIGEAGGQVFLSMEYIDGEDLSSVLRRLGQPGHAKALEIARQICMGLEAAHEKGVLHRDLKPANIMIDGRGCVRITDFGIAGFFEELQGVQATAGTPAYMAPEQLSGGSVSIASDIYSLGLILFEVATGRRAFNTDEIEALKQAHAAGAVPRPSSVSNGLDPVLERGIMHCLQRSPERRPRSVAQVLRALPSGKARRNSKLAKLLARLCQCSHRPILVRRRVAFALAAAICAGVSLFILLGSLGMALAPIRPGATNTQMNTFGWVMAGLSLIPLVIGAGLAALCVAQRLVTDRCHRCGYDTAGLSGQCPECGSPLTS